MIIIEVFASRGTDFAILTGNIPTCRQWRVTSGPASITAFLRNQGPKHEANGVVESSALKPLKLLFLNLVRA